MGVVVRNKDLKIGKSLVVRPFFVSQVQNNNYKFPMFPQVLFLFSEVVFVMFFSDGSSTV